jgi:hypothetical protein
VQLNLNGADGFKLDDLKKLASLKSLKRLSLTEQPDLPRESIEALARELSECKVLSDFGTFQNGKLIEPPVQPIPQEKTEP